MFISIQYIFSCTFYNTISTKVYPIRTLKLVVQVEYGPPQIAQNVVIFYLKDTGVRKLQRILKEL